MRSTETDRKFMNLVRQICTEEQLLSVLKNPAQFELQVTDRSSAGTDKKFMDMARGFMSEEHLNFFTGRPELFKLFAVDQLLTIYEEETKKRKAEQPQPA